MYTPPDTTNVVTDFVGPPFYVAPDTTNIVADFAQSSSGGGSSGTVSLVARTVNFLIM